MRKNKMDSDTENGSHELLPSKKSTENEGDFSVSEAIEACGFRSFQYILCAISGLSWLAGAMEVMLLAILSPSLECEWGLTPVEQALCTTFVFAGWMISSPFWGRICDVYGRRKGLMSCSAVGFVFGILTCFAPSFYLFLAARFSVGFAVGGLPQSVTLTAEFLPAASCAKWGTFLKSFWAVGAAIEAALAMLVLPTLGWRWLVCFSAFPIALHGLACWWLPESVRYDVAQGKIVEARATLDRIAAFNGRSLPEGELRVEKEESSSGMLDLLKGKYTRTTLQLWIIWCLFGLLYYGVAIYTSLLLRSPTGQCSSDDLAAAAAGSSGSFAAAAAESRLKRAAAGAVCRQMTTDNYLNIIITTMSEVPGYILTMYLIDWIGRRPTFAAGFGLFSACAGLLSVCMPRALTIAALFIGRSAIASIFQAGYIYTSEVYPTALRAQGLGVASGFGRFGSMATPVITQMLATQSLSFPAIFFSISGFFGLILSILLPIETKGMK